MLLRPHRLLAVCTVLAALAASEPLARADCGQLPVLLVVQDRSGSMQDAPDPTVGGASKWSIAAGTVPAVLQNYNNNFDFGLMYFPGSSWACDPGYVDLAVGSTPNQIQSSYASTSPTGATPTSDTLKAARDYLNSLHLSVPAYILLITDGMPNCDGNLNGSTCTCTASTNGCNPSNGGTAYNCLDDVATESSASSAYSAGYQVFVVGFGNASTAGNNKQVLDAIAASGGTGHAYSADDQASLQSTLNSIMGSVGTCCANICNPGDTQCDGSGNIQSCTMLGTGCYGWSGGSACGSGQTCQSGSCQSCAGTCTPGATQCGFFGDLQTCAADAQGCTAWQSSWCPSGSACTGASCQSCSNTCTAGATMCQNGQVVTCESDWQGCTSWNAQSCGYGSVCSGNACQACNSTCTAGAQQCVNSGTAEICVADASGCTSWQQTSCGSGQTCSGGSCNACNACSLGETRCAGLTPQSCVDLGNGCTGWQDGSPCAGSQVCANGACMDCSGACNAGDTQCTGSDIQTCEPQAGACNAWVTTQTCAQGEICAAGSGTASCCANACTPGESKCGPNGEVETCVGAAGTCPTWQATACGSGQACVSGTCATACNTQNELGSCPSGYVCQTSAQGSYCLPDGSGSTSGSSGGTTGTSGGSSGTSGSSAGLTGPTTGGSSGGTSGSNVASPGTGSIKASGCGAVDGELLLGLLPALGLLFRRRR